MPYLIIIPIIAGAFAQALKLIIDGIPNNFNWQHLIRDYGGMPSSHTAFVSSLAILVGLDQGFQSAAFAISFVLTAVVIRDAVGFRREIGYNAILTNQVAKAVFKNKKNGLLNEQMGHTLAEVSAGFLLGCSLSILLYLLLMI